jgi:hypothetical protein
MAPFYSSFKPHDHWKKHAPPLTRSSARASMTMKSQERRRGMIMQKENKSVAPFSDEKCLAWGEAEEQDKFLVPIIEDDFNWFRLSIAYLEDVTAATGHHHHYHHHHHHHHRRDSGSWSGTSTDERRGRAISTMTDLEFGRSWVGELMSMEELLATGGIRRDWEMEEEDDKGVDDYDYDYDADDDEEEEEMNLPPPRPASLSRVWQADHIGRVRTYVPNRRRMRWDSPCHEVEANVAPLEMDANRSLTELEGSGCLPQCSETPRVSVTTVQTVKVIKASSSKDIKTGIGRWSGVTLLNL